MNKIIVDALKSYKCQYTQDCDGNGLNLVDVLSPNSDYNYSIKLGLEELELLADHIDVCIEENNETARKT